MVDGMMRAMRHVVATVTAIQLALAARRDLLLEVALHHQVAVLARSNRRFRRSDRLLWLILRRLWPQWSDALVLVQPYDYLYSAPEIQAFGETLQAVRKIVRKTYGYMNNHADAKSVVNAIQIKHVLKEPITGTTIQN